MEVKVAYCYLLDEKANFLDWKERDEHVLSSRKQGFSLNVPYYVPYYAFTASRSRKDNDL